MIKYLYILTSDNTDYYFEQALISLTSLKLRMSSAYVCVLTDTITRKNLTGKRQSILALIDELKVIEIDAQFNKKAVSRYLKTSMRKYIEGDFLFIDCDTVIADDLSDIQNHDIQIGAVLDLHTRLSPHFEYKHGSKKSFFERASFLGYKETLASDAYFNSGVLYCRDTPSVHNLFDNWHKLWLDSYSKNVLTDQMPLNQANNTCGQIIFELDGKWNCQILADGAINYLTDAKILHYFSTHIRDQLYLLREEIILKQIKETGNLPDEIKNKLDCPKALFHPKTLLIASDASLREFHDSATCAIANRFYKSKIGVFFDKLLECIHKNIYLPLKGSNQDR